MCCEQYAFPHFAKSELNCFPRGINPKVKRQYLILIFMLCFQIFWHPVMNSLSHWFEIFFNLWLTPWWCNRKTRWNGLLISILAMLPKGEITFEKCGFKLPTMVFWAVWNTKSTCCFLSQFLSLLIYDKAVTANHITKKFLREQHFYRHLFLFVSDWSLSILSYKHCWLLLWYLWYLHLLTRHFWMWIFTFLYTCIVR